MKLHIGKLYWPDITKVDKLEYSKTIDESKNDVLIVGGGISGSLCAYRLSKAGFKVTLIEQNQIASGSSAANTGLIQYMSDEGVNYYIDKIGKNEAIKFYDMSVKAVQTLIDINSELKKQTNNYFAVKESLILATRRIKVREVKKETKTQKDLGYGAKYLNKKDLQKMYIDAYGALMAKSDIALNPYGFVKILINRAVKYYGLQVLEYTKFLDTKTKDGYQIVGILNNNEKLKLKFKKVIMATGYQVPDFLKTQMKNLKIKKTYVTVSDKNFKLSEETDFLIWEVRNPYTYFRHTFDNRVLIGGLDERGNNLTKRDANKNSKKLIKLTKKMLTDKKIKIKSEYSYAALFGESKDELPYIGLDYSNSNIMVICGAGGNGTIYSTIASEFALDWLNEKDISDYDIFSLNR